MFPSVRAACPLISSCRSPTARTLVDSVCRCHLPQQELPQGGPIPKELPILEYVNTVPLRKCVFKIEDVGYSIWSSGYTLLSKPSQKIGSPLSTPKEPTEGIHPVKPPYGALLPTRIKDIVTLPAVQFHDGASPSKHRKSYVGQSQVPTSKNWGHLFFMDFGCCIRQPHSRFPRACSGSSIAEALCRLQRMIFTSISLTVECWLLSVSAISY